MNEAISSSDRPSMPGRFGVMDGGSARSSSAVPAGPAPASGAFAAPASVGRSVGAGVDMARGDVEGERAEGSTSRGRLTPCRDAAREGLPPGRQLLPLRANTFPSQSSSVTQFSPWGVSEASSEPRDDGLMISIDGRSGER